MEATEQYFPVVPFIMLYKVVLTLDPVNKILTSDHSNKISLSLVVYSALSIFEHFPV